MTQTQSKFKQLQKIEVKARVLASKAIQNNRFNEVMENRNSHLNATRRKWQELITECRGWDVHQGSKKTKKDWIEYCRLNNKYVGYNFDDVIA